MEGMNDELDFWHSEKQQSLLQNDTITLHVSNQACPKVSKISLHIL